MVIAIEAGHHFGPWLPIPYLLLVVAAMYAGVTGGRFAGALAGMIGAGQLLHAHVVGIGPEAVTSSLPQTLGSMAIFILIGYMTGRIADQRNALIDKRIEEQRREQEQPLLLAAKIAKLGYYIWDTVNDQPVVVSDQHARNHGTSVEGFLRTVTTLSSAITLVHPEDRARVIAGYKEARNGLPVTVEYRVATGSDTKWIRTIVQPQTDDSGRVVREICASLDITDQKTNERLFAEAQRLDSVGRLTAGIAHDFNNILTVVTGGLELSRYDSTSADQHRLLTEALDAASRGAKLTKQLLAFGRRSMLAPEALDANLVINRMDTLFRRTLPCNIKVRTRLDCDLPAVKADPIQLESALLNLAINARDAMPEGGALEVETRHQRVTEPAGGSGPEPGDYVVISVSDTGTGISEDAQARVFEPFYTTKPIDKGSGLGLPMVYGFIAQSGGHITLKSQPGEGTTVEMYFPAAEAVASDSAEEPVHLAPPAPAPLAEIGLLIEDPSAWREDRTRQSADIRN
ncbi:ATP-binding protein [Marinovum sp.]|uniref:ATP-binding protein n=1 Tax=Marinovum sp. TaxID=2024839 RepID=UPI003A9292E7